MKRRKFIKNFSAIAGLSLGSSLISEKAFGQSDNQKKRWENLSEKQKDVIKKTLGPIKRDEPREEKANPPSV